MGEGTGEVLVNISNSDLQQPGAINQALQRLKEQNIINPERPLRLPNYDSSFRVQAEAALADQKHETAVITVNSAAEVQRGNIGVKAIGGAQVVKEFPNLIQSPVPNSGQSAESLIGHMQFPASGKQRETGSWFRGRARETGHVNDEYHVVKLPDGYKLVYPAMGTKGNGPSNSEDIAAVAKAEGGTTIVGTEGTTSDRDFGVSHLRGAELEMQVMNQLNILGGRGSFVEGYGTINREQFLLYCKKYHPEYYKSINEGKSLQTDIVAQVRLSDPDRIGDNSLLINFAAKMDHAHSVLSAEYGLNELSSPGSFRSHYNIPTSLDTSFLTEEFDPSNPKHLEGQAKLSTFIATRNIALLSKLGYRLVVGTRDFGWTGTVHDAEGAEDVTAKTEGRLAAGLNRLVERIERVSKIPKLALKAIANLAIKSVG